jgi:hypothetical protein
LEIVIIQREVGYEVGYEGAVERSKRDATGKLKRGGRWRQWNVHEAIGMIGDEVVARSNEVVAAGIDPHHPRNHAEVAKQARHRVDR